MLAPSSCKVKFEYFPPSTTDRLPVDIRSLTSEDRTANLPQTTPSNFEASKTTLENSANTWIMHSLAFRRVHLQQEAQHRNPDHMVKPCGAAAIVNEGEIHLHILRKPVPTGTNPEAAALNTMYGHACIQGARKCANE